MTGTYIAPVLAHSCMSPPFVTWLMAGFIRDIPSELLEAASVMGCSRMGAFWKIILPLVKPAIASAAILVMQSSWNVPMNEQRRRDGRYDVEELGVGFVRFKNDITLDLFESWAVHLDSMAPNMILGSLGGIKLEPFSFHTTICDVELDCTGNLEQMDFRWKQTLSEEKAYASSEAHWIAALLGKVPMLPTARLALSTLLIQEGITLSDKLGREVTSDEVRAASVLSDLYF